MAKGLLIVDMQNDFMDFENSALPVPGASEIINPMKDYLSNIPFKAHSVVTTQDWHTEDHVEYDPDGNPFPKHCVKGTWGAELVYNPITIAGEGDSRSRSITQLYKNEFDMWKEEDLTIYNRTPHDVLNEIDRDDFFHLVQSHGEVDTFQVMGVAADVCVYFAIRGLLARGFNVEIKNSLTRGIFKSMEEVVEDYFDYDLQQGRLTLLDM